MVYASYYINTCNTALDFMTKSNFNIKRIEKICNSIEVASVGLILLLAFSLQVILHELPCPLCLLQRAGFFMIAIGFLMNLKFGLHPSHYAMVILGCVFTSAVALRQILLHIVPGTGSYGSTVFGLHLYTWSFILAMGILIDTAILMSFDRQYLRPITKRNRLYKVTNILFAGLVILLFINIGSVLLECGIMQCPDNPTTY